MSGEGGNRYSFCTWGWMVPNTQDDSYDPAHKLGRKRAEL